MIKLGTPMQRNNIGHESWGAYLRDFIRKLPVLFVVVSVYSNLK